MVRSMTGYAQGQQEDGAWTVRVTVKAVNHRFLDLRLRLPVELEAAEPHLRALVRDHIQRGHVDVQFQIEHRETRALEIDEEFVGRALELYRTLQQRHRLSGEPDLAVVLRLPGALRSGTAMPEPEDAERLQALAARLLEETLARMEEMRRAEGAALERELRGCLEQIDQERQALLGLSEQVLAAFQRHLRQRLEELLGESPLDPARLAEEAAYLAERSDVREELTRLGSHTEQFARLLESDAAVGKRLDFLLQEMNRETTTLLSKAPALEGEGLEMTRRSLEIKAHIERLREQVQNVE